jgi:hypothetical protein
LDAKSELNGYGFPFDRLHLIFYKRLKTARSIVENLSAKKKKDKYMAISGFLKHVMDYNLLYLQILYRICFDYVNDRICSEYSNDQSRALDPQKNQPVLRRAL